MSIKILIVGPGEVGSTRLFNLIRHIYLNKNISVHSHFIHFHNPIIETNNNTDVIVCKAHDISLDFLKHFDIILLPLRNLLDAAISAVKKGGGVHKDKCKHNIFLYNKFKKFSQFTFVYEKYSIHHIKELCSILNVELSNMEIIKIMRKLDEMINDNSVPQNTDFSNKKYRQTLVSKSNNTSGGQSNKFVTELNDDELEDILNDPQIYTFMQEHKYL